MMFLIVFIVIMLAFATEGFTNFVFWGRNNKHRFCEKCGRRVKEVSNNFDPVMSCLHGFEKTYVCTKCKHIQTAHCYTYD